MRRFVIWLVVWGVACSPDEPVHNVDAGRGAGVSCTDYLDEEACRVCLHYLDDETCLGIGECAGLDEAACISAESCSPTYASPLERSCVNNPSAEPVYGGCVWAELACALATACGQRGTEQLLFPDSCVPPGYSPCWGCGSFACSHAAPAPVRQVCVRGRADADGEHLDAAARIRVQVFPSEGVSLHHGACQVTESGGALSVEAALCPAADDDACTDCFSSRFAGCSSDVLAAGDYTLSLGGIGLGFTVPSIVPHGGLCAD